MVRLSYEPSVQSVLDAVLPPSAELIADRRRLRERVAWPLLARATGLGEIRGGEIVLAPSARVEKLLPHALTLHQAGVVALVIVGTVSEEARRAAKDADLPIGLVGEDVDLRRLQSEMEQFIIRRRRELFDLSQQLHRSLVEAAIGGMEVQGLLNVAHDFTHKPVLLDRDGDILGAGDVEMVDNPPLLLEARIAMHGQVDGCIPLSGPPTSLAAPVLKGNERRGIVLLLEVDDSSLDEAETVLATLGSACAITLGREPTVRIAAVDELFAGTGGVRLRDDQGSWVAVAVRDLSVPEPRLERALASELGTRGANFMLGRQDDALIAMVAAASAPSWGAVLRAVQLRLGSNQTTAGVGRAYARAEGARQSVREAAAALERTAHGELTRYESVEMEVLLCRLPNWEEFVRGRLGPLMESATNRRELLQTLQVYLESGQNATEAARRLQVHRNTLLYRLTGIRKLLHVDLEDPEEVFALELALRILAAHGGEISGNADNG